MISGRVRRCVLLVGAGLFAVPACQTSSGDDGDDDSSGSASSRCLTYCDDAQRAVCADFDHGSCVAGCTDIADMEKDTSQCAQEVDQLLGCWEGLADVCQSLLVDLDTRTLVVCDSEARDYTNCYRAYCQDHTSASYCS